MVTNKQPGEPRASLLVEHWAKQTFAKIPVCAGEADFKHTRYNLL